MNIIIHTDEYYPTAQACSYRMQVFVDTFIERGNKVTVITSSANKSNGPFGIRNHKERILYSPAIRMRKKTSLMRMLNNISFGISSVCSSIIAGRADIVITTSPPPLVSIPGWIIAKLKRAKLVYDVRDIWPDVALEMGSFTEDSFFCKVFSKITNYMYKHADIITTVSSGKVEKIKYHVISASGDKGENQNIDKVWLIGNGFDESILDSQIDQSIIDKYDLDHKFTCVYIGNIGLAQGLDILIDLAKQTRHKDIQFLCFGKGAEKEKLEQRVKDEELDNVKFCGVIDHDKVYSILSRAKVSFIPLKSSNMKDSVPTKIYESLGIGCPVMLVAEGDSVEILKETKLGRHISPSDTENLTQVFDDFIDDYDSIVWNKNESIRIMKDKYSRQDIALDFEKKLRAIIDNN